MSTWHVRQSSDFTGSARLKLDSHQRGSSKRSFIQRAQQCAEAEGGSVELQSIGAGWRSVNIRLSICS